MCHRCAQDDVIEKCTFCYHRVLNGLQPACVEACPARPASLATRKTRTADRAILKSEKSFRLQEEKGTKPNVHYIGKYSGFDLDPEFKDLPDHVAVELEFLYVLTFNTTQADRDGKVDEAAATEQLRQRFLSEHLGAWIEPFSAAVTANAQTTFYQELAALTRSFVQAEMVRPVIH
jgi:nitrate reductase assembly molybdenum cofactor insertion protein NarJ